eukprot:2908811-Amphidinium_carterae.2
MPGFDIWTPENKRGTLLSEALGADQVPHAFHYPTRREGISMSAPDAMILTNLAVSSRVSTTALPQGGSDHIPISACLQGKGDWPHLRRVPRWSLPKADWQSFEGALSAGRTGLPDRTACIQKRYSALEALLLSSGRLRIPMGTGKKAAKSWWNDSLTELMEEREQVLRAIGSTDSTEEQTHLAEKSASLRAEFSKQVKVAKAKSWESFCDSLSTKPGEEGDLPYGVLRSMLGRQVGLHHAVLRTKSGKLEFHPENRAELLARHYAGLRQQESPDPHLWNGDNDALVEKPLKRSSALTPWSPPRSNSMKSRLRSNGWRPI